MPRKSFWSLLSVFTKIESTNSKQCPYEREINPFRLELVKKSKVLLNTSISNTGRNMANQRYKSLNEGDPPIPGEKQSVLCSTALQLFKEQPIIEIVIIFQKWSNAAAAFQSTLSWCGRNKR